MTKGSLHRALLTSNVVSTLLLVVPLVVLTVVLVRVRLAEQIESVSRYVHSETKTAIRERVDEAAGYADFMHRQLDERARSRVKSRTEEAHAIATRIFEQFHDKLPRADLQRLVREALRPIRFDNGRGYYFATDFTGTEQLFADRPELEGKNLLGMTDGAGKPVIRDMIEIARTRGEDFYEYIWTKPGHEGKHHRKVSYVKRFAPFDWFIGTGLYADDVEEEIKQEVLERIGAIRWGEDGYVFVLRSDGVVLQHAERKFVGAPLQSAADPNGLKVTDRLIDAARSGGGYVEYSWMKYSTGQVTPKIAYARHLDSWDWIIGAGDYLDDILAHQNNQVAELRSDTLTVVAGVGLLTFVSLLGSLAYARRFRKNLAQQIQPIQSFLAAHPDHRPSLDPDAPRYEELRNIAAAALQLDRQWRQAQQELRDSETQVRQLNEDLEQRVRRRTAELEAALAELEGFSYSISHDLRSPLRAIDGYAAVIREDYGDRLDEEGMRIFERIRHNAQRMGNLIDDILAFSRAGRQDLTVQPVAVAALAGTVWQELEAQRAGRNIDFRLGDLPQGLGDPAAVKQILHNLLANALKFTREQTSAVIEVGGRREGDQCVYWIADNGCGFDEQYAEKLFGLFQRLHNDQGIEGTGVGLAIVKRFVVKLNGRVWANGRPGQGATFWFALPAPSAQA